MTGPPREAAFPAPFPPPTALPGSLAGLPGVSQSRGGEGSPAGDGSPPRRKSKGSRGGGLQRPLSAPLAHGPIP